MKLDLSSPPGGRRAVLVLGMHRSGTSAITRVLGLLGAALPKNPLRPNSNNPTGFYEPKSIVKLHNRLLDSIGGAWNTLGKLRLERMEIATARELRDALAAEVAAQFGEAPVFVLKDPRLCRLVPKWISTLEEINIAPVFIHIIRNPLEVAASLAKRNHMPRASSLLLWLRHNLEAEAGSRCCPRAFVSYENLLSDWRGVAARLQSAIGFPATPPGPAAAAQIDGFLSGELRHHRLPLQALAQAGEIPALIRDAAAVLDEAARCGESPDFTKRMDRLRQRLAEADHIAEPLLGELRERLAEKSQQTAQNASHAAQIEAARAETKAAHAETEAARAEAKAARSETERASAETKAARAETEATRAEIETARAETETARAETKAARAETEAARAEAKAARAETETARVETRAARAETETAHAETEAMRDALCLPQQSADPQ